MDNCIFCKLANGEIPTTTIYENEDFRVILDAAPANLGHCLVLPKAHGANIFELDSSLVAKGFQVAQKIAKAVKAATDCDGINILQNNGEAAGQTVFHFHIHIIPRYKSDDVNIGFGTFKTDDPSVIADKLISCIEE